MRKRWKADRHAEGWAVYRQRRGQLEPFRLPSEPTPLTFDQQRAAVVWAQFLNDVSQARR